MKHCIKHHIPLPFDNESAKKVLKKLHQANFEAYIVGGAVRDSLLGIAPKDHDIATNATPEQVRQLFKGNSRIIGRRFQIVHVVIDQELIEVSTFRSGQAQQNEWGRITRDNQYGSLEEDAQRRDFTCNALYYNIFTQEVLDFHHGLRDIRAKKLVMIGDPATRYQEDPVRILRAIRFCGKLGFSPNTATLAPIHQQAHLLKHEPPSRLFEEILKIMFSGHAINCMKWLAQFNIKENIHPLLNALQQAVNDTQANLITHTLTQTDIRLQQGKTTSIGFILAAMLWENVQTRWQFHQKNASADNAMSLAIADLRPIMDSWDISQRFSGIVREIWSLQPRFLNRRHSRPFRFMAQPRFRSAYDFFLLRAQLGEVPTELSQWWTTFITADDATRKNMAETAPMPPHHKKKKRKRRKSAKNAPLSNNQTVQNIDLQNFE